MPEPMNPALSPVQLLRASQSGQKEALDQLIPLVYEQLRLIASRQLSREKPGHTLHPTALAHEVYLKLVGADVSFADQAHFFAIASRLVRRILIDHAKTHSRGKRGGGAARVTLDEGLVMSADTSDTLLAIHEALEQLGEFDPRKAQIVELVYFGGVEQDLAAEAVHVSPATLRRELRLAKAWLYNVLRPSKE